MTFSLKQVLNLFLIGLLAFFCYLMLEISLLYIHFEPKVGFLMVKQQAYQLDLWRLAFYIHVFTSMFALVAGFTQFFGSILRKHKKLHRNVGKIYVAVVLLLSGPSGLFMAFFARGGFPSQIAFLCLSLLWLGFTGLAFYHIRNRNFRLHEEFMIRSYALTLSAVTLRSWKWLLANTIEPRPLDLYILVAWLGFIPNMFIAEWIISRRRKKNP